MRYLLLSVATLVVGYVVGTIFGYRTAVVDYVENDAQTIEQIADTIYDSPPEDNIPEEVKEKMKEGYKKKAEETESSSEETDSRAFH